MASILLVYILPTVLLVGGYLFLRRRDSRRNRDEQAEARATGMHEPASLHPVIEHSRCFGCGACVAACPEQSVLGLINGKAELIAAANCIGHGACRAACPTSAITLVFGTATRGVDIPHVQPNFETNVPGVFIAGELGGMGLIRNAVEQGRQAVTYIHRALPPDHGCELDLLIVGAGPSGIAASLAAKELGLRFLTMDQDSLGGTVSHFPRRKIVMTQPARLPLVGKVRFRETTKEALLEFWQDVVAREQLQISHGERLEDIERLADGFAINTTGRRYRARSVLLCLGRRGTPRRLDVPGEERSKVVYRLIDTEQYCHQHVLVVGGGDSAVEAAVSVADAPGTQVALSYRGASFSRVKTKNRARLEAAVAAGRVRVLLESRVTAIREREVLLQHGGQPLTLANDAVIVCAGGILPNTLLEKIGIALETKYGSA